MSCGTLLEFPYGSLSTRNGEIADVKRLSGKSVALYFASYDHPKCMSFLPFLKQFYHSINQGSPEGKIEIIFVSLDSTKEKYLQHRSLMPWVSIDYDNDLRTTLRQKYKLKIEDVPARGRAAGSAPSTGLPRLLVIGESGEQMHWLQCEHSGPVILKEWDFHSHRFH